MCKGLSSLQRFVLQETYKGHHITTADILNKRYGFKQVSSGKIKFNRQQIGMKRYLSASAAVARSLTRLRDRELMARNWEGHHLTEAGIQAVEKLLGNG